MAARRSIRVGRDRCQPHEIQLVDDWLQSIQGFVFPPSCILCGARGQRPTLDLCTGCAADLPANRPACLRCAAPLAGDDAVARECGRCLARSPVFDRAFVPFRYAYPIDQLVRTFKYQGTLAWGRVLATLLAQHLRASAARVPQTLIPVPLHPERHRERGFNQAEELARPLSRLLGIAIEDRLCERVRDTQNQTELNARQRRKNLRNAFQLTRATDLEHVALIDDVLTTGSTVSELARTLKRAGVKVVDVWAVARAVRR